MCSYFWTEAALAGLPGRSLHLRLQHFLGRLIVVDAGVSRHPLVSASTGIVATPVEGPVEPLRTVNRVGSAPRRRGRRRRRSRPRKPKTLLHVSFAA